MVLGQLGHGLVLLTLGVTLCDTQRTHDTVQQPPSPTPFVAPRTIGGAASDWLLNSTSEMEVWNHTVVSPAGLLHGAYLNHFWSAGGKGAVGQYVADTQIVRYYIDGEV